MQRAWRVQWLVRPLQGHAASICSSWENDSSVWEVSAGRGSIGMLRTRWFSSPVVVCVCVCLCVRTLTQMCFLLLCWLLQIQLLWLLPSPTLLLLLIEWWLVLYNLMRPEPENVNPKVSVFIDILIVAASTSSLLFSLLNSNGCIAGE